MNRSIIVTCSVILWLSTWLRLRILMATWSPFSTFFANLTLAKLPSPMVFPSSYFPKRVRGLTGFPLIFSFPMLSAWSYETGLINEYESLACLKICFCLRWWWRWVTRETKGFREKKKTNVFDDCVLEACRETWSLAWYSCLFWEEKNTT